MLQSEFFAVSDVGLQRRNNEDNHLNCPELGLWLVADGMGGHAAGEVASAIACDATKASIQQGSRLDEAFLKAHRAVLDAAEKGVGGQGMGSTIVGLHCDYERFQISWVGDSRAYLWRRHTTEPEDHPHFTSGLQQLTSDHSYVQMLLDSGAIGEHEFQNHPDKNIITQCLGSLEIEQPKPGTVEHLWESGDWIILCSDGLTDCVTNQDIESILSEHQKIQPATDALLQAALKAGGKDNITVLMVAAPPSLSKLVNKGMTAIKSIFNH